MKRRNARHQGRSFAAVFSIVALIAICAPLVAESPASEKTATGEGLPRLAETKILRTTFECELPRLALGVYDNRSGDDLRYEPNNPCEFKIGAQYGKLGAKVGLFSVKADSARSVGTTSFDFHGFYYFERFGADLYAQWYRGFYLAGTSQDCPDFELTTLTANGYMKLAGTCGIDALKTPIVDGGPVDLLAYAFASVSRRTIDAGGRLVPENQSANFQTLGKTETFSAVIPSLSAGTLLSLHCGNFYFTPGLSIGFGYPVVETPRDVRVINSIKINLKARAGYEGKKWIAGIEVSNDSDSIELGEHDAIQFHSVVANIFVGRKFEIQKKKK